MTNEPSEPQNIALEQLRLVREDLRLVRNDIERVDRKFDAKFDDLSHKIGGLARTLVIVQRDVKGLKDSVTTLAIATAENNERLDRLDA